MTQLIIDFVEMVDNEDDEEGYIKINIKMTMNEDDSLVADDTLRSCCPAASAYSLSSSEKPISIFS